MNETRKCPVRSHTCQIPGSIQNTRQRAPFGENLLCAQHDAWHTATSSTRPCRLCISWPETVFILNILYPGCTLELFGEIYKNTEEQPHPSTPDILAYLVWCLDQESSIFFLDLCNLFSRTTRVASSTEKYCLLMLIIMMVTPIQTCTQVLLHAASYAVWFHNLSMENSG